MLLLVILNKEGDFEPPLSEECQRDIPGERHFLSTLTPREVQRRGSPSLCDCLSQQGVSVLL